MKITIALSGFPGDPNDDLYFPKGPLGRCPTCGRKVVLPCLACETEDGFWCRGPEDDDDDDDDDGNNGSGVNLEDPEHEVYEKFHKVRKDHGMPLKQYRKKKGDDN